MFKFIIRLIRRLYQEYKHSDFSYYIGKQGYITFTSPYYYSKYDIILEGFLDLIPIEKRIDGVVVINLTTGEHIYYDGEFNLFWRGVDGTCINDINKDDIFKIYGMAIKIN